MLEKLTVFTILFAVFAIISAQNMDSSVIPPRPSKPNDIKCYTCDNPHFCRAPKTVICDQNSANKTHLALAKYFPNIPEETETKFECLKIKYLIKKTIEIDIRGCVNVGFNVCNLKPLNATLASANKTCAHCSKSLCNPAGTFSSSSVVTVAAVFGLLLLKSLHF